MIFSDAEPIPAPAMAPVKTSRRRLTIGLPRSADAAERRFPLTPEGAAMLIERGLGVNMEAGASESIHYTDTRYSAAGVSIVRRPSALGCDMVISLAPPSVDDIRAMRRGAVLFMLFDASRLSAESTRALLDRHIIVIAIDLIRDDAEHTPFADILAEIDGRAALACAGSLLADSVHGKGILLGGIAGIVPCEVTVIGSGIAARAAARAASGAGAMVRMFDNDVYRLRDASRELGSWVITSAIHTHVLHNALRSADVVVYTGCQPADVVIGSDVAATMKKGVIVFDLTNGRGAAFPSMQTVDLAKASPAGTGNKINTRLCYINAGGAVPRTAAMALSNTFFTLLTRVVDFDSIDNALKFIPGLQCAALAFLGKAVNPAFARIADVRSVDINIFLNLS